MPRRFARATNRSAGRHDGRQSGSRGQEFRRDRALLLADKQWIVAIPSTRRLERVDGNIEAVAAELTSNGLYGIEGGASNAMVEEGLRAEHLERMIYR